MQNILITGAGKIGSLIACLLAESDDYNVTLADLSFDGADIKHLIEAVKNVQTKEIDVRDHDAMSAFIQESQFEAVISSLPYYCNVEVAELAKEFDLHYFDLTEDVNVTAAVKELAKGAKSAFVPQCGLAPGFIGIVANSLMKNFDEVDIVKMRVGALPINASNALHYSLTWSTDGVINEYGNACFGIVDGKEVLLHPLQGLESIQLDGTEYEAFNTSGGLGSLTELYDGKVNAMNYKTMRYPGHCLKMRLLMNDLKLNQDRGTLKRILENAIPKTYQDVVIVYVSVTGYKNGQLMEENYVNKVYPQNISDVDWSAIQVTTASGICAVVDLVLTGEKKHQGFVYQEDFDLQDILDNRFGRHYIMDEDDFMLEQLGVEL